MAARSPGDGYTMFLAGVATHGINPNLRKKLPYDALKDFQAVSLIASAPLLQTAQAAVGTVIANQQIAELPLETLPARVVLPRRAPAVAPPVAVRLDDLPHPPVLRENRPPLARRDLVRRIEAQRAYIAECPY